MNRIAIAVLLLVVLMTPSALEAKAKITIENIDGPGVGFNDLTLVPPIGGNSGITLGEQRLIAFNRAAQIWGETLNSDVEIIVRATFAPITGDGCTATSAVLGQARAERIVADFPNAPRPGVWYPIALANALAGEDLAPGVADIFAQFNSLVDNQQCLGSSDWYYGLDANHGNDIDLVVVLLHEFAHGLGMSGSVNLTSGAQTQGMPNVFEFNALDLGTGLHWDQMTAGQRMTSSTNTGNLVWDGPATRNAINKFLGPVTTLTVTSPTTLARNYDIGSASFGPRADLTALSGRIVEALDPADAAGASTTDGCSAFTNASQVAGNIALVDRGTCPFVQKALNAQAANATGLVIVDNMRDTCTPPSLGGDNASVRIPVISVNINDGAVLRAGLADGVDATLRVDGSARSGASQQGFARLYAPCTIAAGSSVHHWDVSAFPNLLMEPNISDDLKHVVDITVHQLIDIGWTATTDEADPEPSGRRILRRGR